MSRALIAKHALKQYLAFHALAALPSNVVDMQQLLRVSQCYMLSQHLYDSAHMGARICAPREIQLMLQTRLAGCRGR